MAFGDVEGLIHSYAQPGQLVMVFAEKAALISHSLVKIRLACCILSRVTLIKIAANPKPAIKPASPHPLRSLGQGSKEH
ncbi:hypothetical protein SKAU_G00359960 [Synaphobranchus kaupii]|uniref:Uncharacterized protein n=1 Tax=Synaphobranchus kaupii TaxID=118154 RepID=A0A9Q1IFZ9_SYNKA|nr:hypothetical protein SKAU_G00359960 [Synaphobranchus kaupii]